MTTILPTLAPLPNSADTLPCVLLTGFDAFGTELPGQQPLNPSWMAAQALHGETIAGHRVVGALLPTVFATADSTLLHLMHHHKPSLVVCVGQASGRKSLSIERIAINLVDAAIADNAGDQPSNQPVLPGQPAAYFSTLPVLAILQVLLIADLPAELSLSAGTFVCNQVFYRLMHALATQLQFAQTQGGFIHVPFLPSQGEPSLPLDDTVRGLRLTLACALTQPIATA